jgi:hypothetical protein
LTRCMLELRKEGRSWTMVWDADEYFGFNYHVMDEEMPLWCTFKKKDSKKCHKDYVASIQDGTHPRGRLPEQGSNVTVAQFIASGIDPMYDQTQKPCICFPRVTVGAKESTTDEIQKEVSSGFNATLFNTLRFRHHGRRQDQVKGKSIVDVSRMKWKSGVPSDAHLPIKNGCRSKAYVSYAELSFRVNHYTGSLESFVRPGFDARGERAFKQRNDYEVFGQDDTTRSWLSRFAQQVGKEKAIALTQTSRLAAMAETADMMTQHERHVLFGFKNMTSDQSKTIESVEPQNEAIDSGEPQNETMESDEPVAETVTIVSKNSTELFPKDPFTFSGCLLIKDANQLLPEWLAYHYTVLPLRRLIVAVDPLSLTQPDTIFDSFREIGMNITVWKDDWFIWEGRLSFTKNNYLKPNSTSDEKFKRHRYRQATFNARCTQALRREGRTWTMIIDPDEYLSFNYHVLDEEVMCDGKKKDRKQCHKDYVKSIQDGTHPRGRLPEQGSNVTIAQFIASGIDPMYNNSGRKHCVCFSRVNVGSKESTVDQIYKQVPSGFNATLFDTLRFRHHGERRSKLPGKCISDVKRASYTLKQMNPHQPGNCINGPQVSLGY